MTQDQKKKTAEYCFKIINKAIVSIKSDYNKFVFAVCTDNEAKMRKMKELIKQEYPDMLTYGYNAHYMNLLQKDICNSFSTILKQVVEVQKYFRNVHMAHGLLKEKGGCMPQLPNETRWNSQVACIETYQKNYNFYVEIYREKMEDFPANIGRIIEKIAIKREASHLLSQMKKLGVALDKMQSDSCHLSDAVHIWYSLIKDEELSIYYDAIKKRFQDAVQPFHILAYITDHRYVDDYKSFIDNDNENSAEQWLEDRNPDFLGLLYKFNLKDREVFPKQMFSESLKVISPSEWWNIMKGKVTRSQIRDKEVSTNFCSFLASLHSCPASSASIERWFSTFGFVWSKIRNRLGADKAMKLVKIYKSFHNSSAADSSSCYDIESDQ